MFTLRVAAIMMMMSMLLWLLMLVGVFTMVMVTIMFLLAVMGLVILGPELRFAFECLIKRRRFILGRSLF